MAVAPAGIEWVRGKTRESLRSGKVPLCRLLFHGRVDSLTTNWSLALVVVGRRWGAAAMHLK